MPEFVLPDMTCGHCVKSVTQTVQQVDPQAQVAVDLPSHRVTITSAATTLDTVRLAQALTDAGYPPAP